MSSHHVAESSYDESRGDHRGGRVAWQCRGRCLKCGTKLAGYRRIRACVCGGRVRY